MRVKMSKPPPPAPTASAIGPPPSCNQNCRTPQHWKFTQHHRTTRPPPVIQIVGRPGTGSLPRTIAPPDHPPHWKFTQDHRTTRPSPVRPGTGSLPSTIAPPNHHPVNRGSQWMEKVHMYPFAVVCWLVGWLFCV